MPAPTAASALLFLLLRGPHGREQHLTTTAAHAHGFPEESFNYNLFSKNGLFNCKVHEKDNVTETERTLEKVGPML